LRDREHIARVGDSLGKDRVLPEALDKMIDNLAGVVRVGGSEVDPT
jgi:hypothetical protein